MKIDVSPAPAPAHAPGSFAALVFPEPRAPRTYTLELTEAEAVALFLSIDSDTAHKYLPEYPGHHAVTLTMAEQYAEAVESALYGKLLESGAFADAG